MTPEEMWARADALLDRGRSRQGFALMNRAARAGDPNAQNTIAVLFETGRGTMKNLRRARFWYRRAIENGSELALANLGTLEFARGRVGLARRLLQRAVRRGLIEALVDLAKLSLRLEEKARARRELRRLLESKQPRVESVEEEARALLASLRGDS